MSASNGKPCLIDTLAIVGVGLIGGSFASALKKAGVVKRVIGAGRRPENLQKACNLGLIEEAVTLSQAASQSDVIFLATPVGAFESILAAMRPTLNTPCRHHRWWQHQAGRDCCCAHGVG